MLSFGSKQSFNWEKKNKFNNFAKFMLKMIFLLPCNSYIIKKNIFKKTFKMKANTIRLNPTMLSHINVSRA